jgi:hypothetical protein
MALILLPIFNELTSFYQYNTAGGEMEQKANKKVKLNMLTPLTLTYLLSYNEIANMLA